MGQEERKNKAKLEKTQINLATSNAEYESAVKVLEETTGRWNRDWKAAADKFQDLEEERLDFTKSSLWTFANIASTVCVSDDGSCEKVRLSLESCEVEKDIMSFIKDRGTGQEIPDPPKYINFCRGDLNDTQSESSEDDSYSVAQFPRTINPSYRTSSPQPSTYESHHDPNSSLAQDFGHGEPEAPAARDTSLDPQVTPKALSDRRQSQVGNQQQMGRPQYVQPQPRQSSRHQSYEQPPKQHVEYQPTRHQLYEQTPKPQVENQSARHSLYEQPLKPQVESQPARHSLYEQPPKQHIENQPTRHQLYEQPPKPYIENQPTRHQLYDQPIQQQRQPQLANQPRQNRLQYDQAQHGPVSTVPHDPYPMDGMTMLCRTAGPPSERSSAASPNRPMSRDSQSDYSNPTSFSSQEPPSRKQSPIKQEVILSPTPERTLQKKKSTGFFQAKSPFRRKSKHEKENPLISPEPHRNTWSASNQNTPTHRRQAYSQDVKNKNMITDRESGSPEEIDPRASYQLNVGNNVFDVAAPDRRGKPAQQPAPEQEDLDPIAQALAELKGVSKESSTRVSADRYHGIATPAPGASRPTVAPMMSGALVPGMRGTPPPSYDQPPVQRLGLPQPAFTSKAMKQSTQKYVSKKQDMFSAPTRPAPQQHRSSFSQPRPGTRDSDVPRAISPLPPRAISPRPVVQEQRPVSPRPIVQEQRAVSPHPVVQERRAVSPHPMVQDRRAVSPRPIVQERRAVYPRPIVQERRAVSPRPIVQDRRQSFTASPNAYAASPRSPSQYNSPRTPQSATPQQRGSALGYYRQNSPSVNSPIDVARAVSPAPFREQQSRPGSSHVGGDMSIQLAPDIDGYGGGSQYGSQHGGSQHGGSQYGGSQYGGSRRGSDNNMRPSTGNSNARPLSYYNGQQGGQLQMAPSTRQRSKSVVDGRQFTREGRPILHFGK